MKKFLGALLVASTAISTAANAQELEYRPYVGLDYNYTHVSSFTHFNSGSVNVGTMYNQYFGTELFYQLSDTNHKSELNSSFSAYGLDITGYLPLGCDRVFSLLATAGIGEYKFKVKSFDASEIEHSKEHGLGYRLGLGAKYDIDENISIRAIGRYIHFDKVNSLDNATEFTLGARYGF